MASIDFKQIRRAVLGDTTLQMEDLNVALIIRILGELNPPGEPSVTPHKVQNLAEVMRLFKPAISINLKDENGETAEYRLRYYEGVRTSTDVMPAFRPENIPYRLARADGNESLPLLLRLLAKIAALRQLRESLPAAGTISAEDVKKLTGVAP